jgi:hypothetical protein
MKEKTEGCNSSWEETAVTNIFEFEPYPSGNDFPIITTEKGDEGYLLVNHSGYVCLLGTCKLSVSESDLKNWDKHYGLFLNFDIKDGDKFKPIYIEEI